MELLSRFAIESEEEQEQWEEIEVEASETDNSETIPNEIVNIMIDEDVSLLAAWRIYRKLSQYDVAEKTGLTQSAISQAERKESKPQKKTLERLAKIYDCKPSHLTL
ncbi:helix-turn-helix domain-containing protein [Ursidibacter sp. B-7004-1]